MKMWLNWKVLAGLGAAGVGIYLVAPELTVAVLPLLLLAACLLMILFMMKGMQGSQDKAPRQEEEGPQGETGAGLTREEDKNGKDR